MNPEFMWPNAAMTASDDLRHSFLATYLSVFLVHILHAIIFCAIYVFRCDILWAMAVLERGWKPQKHTAFLETFFV